ncbi:MAG: YfbR-like 5'-deoxynucleotidase [Candidatus Woesearchaeota archaeon]
MESIIDEGERQSGTENQMEMYLLAYHLIKEDLKRFTGRMESLKAIKRFMMEDRTPMHYRTDDHIHSSRTACITMELLPYFKDHKFGPGYAITLACVHDDLEELTDDIQTPVKMSMTREEREKFRQEESDAIQDLYMDRPDEVGGWPYIQLLYDAMDKISPESRLVKLADMLDGLGESLHELFAGNTRFEHPVRNYSRLIREHYHANRDLWYGIPEWIIDPSFPGVKEPSFHDKKLIMEDTGSPHYEFWKRVTLQYAGRDPDFGDGMKLLTEVKERE